MSKDIKIKKGDSLLLKNGQVVKVIDIKTDPVKVRLEVRRPSSDTAIVALEDIAGLAH